MKRRIELRKEALLEECQVSPSVFRGVEDRLDRFVEPFAGYSTRKEQREHAETMVSGLISDLDHKNIESIAYRHDQDRKDLQHFMGESNWDHEPLMTELARQVGQQLGRDDAALVFDPSGFPKKGTESVGVQRQWCGRICDDGGVVSRNGNASRKKWTPAITLPQIREGIAHLLHAAADCDGPTRVARERNQLARLHHWKRHNKLPPLNIEKRQI